MQSLTPNGRPARAGKVLFADQLRAVAALCVMITHLLGSYWVARDVVAAHVFAPVPDGPAAGVTRAISFTWFNFGPFGVSLFFLVSGFVIPFSISRATRLRFLAARALRIYPTYVACLALSLAAVWLSSRYWGRPFTWSGRDIAINAALLQSVLAVESIDLVNWSLAIELKFYLVVCLMAAWIRKGSAMALLAVAAALCGLILAQAHLLPEPWQLVATPGLPLHLPFVAHDLLFIPYMLIGTAFSFHFQRRIGTVQLLAVAAVLFGMFFAVWPHTILLPQYPVIPLNYFFALCLFAAAYALREKWRPIGVVDWLAGVSYPLYALHSLVGYAAIRFLMGIGLGYYGAVTIAVPLVLALAYAVHRAVEVPTQEWGKRLARRGGAPVADEGERAAERAQAVRVS